MKMLHRESRKFKEVLISMISYVITCVEYGSKRDFSGLAWIIKYMEQNVILKWFSVRKIKEKIQKFRFFFRSCF